MSHSEEPLSHCREVTGEPAPWICACKAVAPLATKVENPPAMRFGPELPTAWPTMSCVPECDKASYHTRSLGRLWLEVVRLERNAVVV